MRFDWKSAVINLMSGLDAVEAGPVGKVNVLGGGGGVGFTLFTLAFALVCGGGFIRLNWFLLCIRGSRPGHEMSQFDYQDDAFVKIHRRE